MKDGLLKGTIWFSSLSASMGTQRKLLRMVCMMTQSTCYKGTSKMKPVGVLWHSTAQTIQLWNGMCNRMTMRLTVRPCLRSWVQTRIVMLIVMPWQCNGWKFSMRNPKIKGGPLSIWTSVWIRHPFGTRFWRRRRFVRWPMAANCNFAGLYGR